MIFDEIMNRGDQFFILKDFDSYCEACEKADKFYQNKKKWAEAAIHNIAHAGHFSSDRTIEEYNRDIWHLQKIAVKGDDE